MSGIKQTLKGRIVIIAVLLLPLYVLPTIARFALLNAGLPIAGILLSDAFGCFCVGFVTNNFRFGLLLYAGLTVLEFVVLALTHNPLLTIWCGDLVPALIAIYFSQRLYVNMGV
jgi:hypothetical protein